MPTCAHQGIPARVKQSQIHLPLHSFLSLLIFSLFFLYLSLSLTPSLFILCAVSL